VTKKNYNSDGIVSFKGTRAKDFTYNSFNGGPVALKASKGKLLLLDFWETWCGYCFLAMPKIKSLYSEYKEKGLEIIAVVTENKEQVQKIISARKFPYVTVYADEKIKEAYKLMGRPRYLLIDDAGIIVADIEGNFQTVEEEIKKRLK
jgi:thiol-disulfide isomerase/thioredoxin